MYTIDLTAWSACIYSRHTKRRGARLPVGKDNMSNVESILARIETLAALRKLARSNGDKAEAMRLRNEIVALRSYGFDVAVSEFRAVCGKVAA
jgi:hypothetical protein